MNTTLNDYAKAERRILIKSATPETVLEQCLRMRAEHDESRLHKLESAMRGAIRLLDKSESGNAALLLSTALKQ